MSGFQGFSWEIQMAFASSTIRMWTAWYIGLNEAAYRWGLRGMAIWSLGQEDMRLWEHMPKQI